MTPYALARAQYIAACRVYAHRRTDDNQALMLNALDRWVDAWMAERVAT